MKEPTKLSRAQERMLARLRAAPERREQRPSGYHLAYRDARAWWQTAGVLRRRGLIDIRGGWAILLGDEGSESL